MNSRALYLLPLLTLLIMAGFFGWSLLSGREPESIGTAMVGHAAPPLGVPSLRPGEPALADDLLHAGKPVLVNFFASWCAPCLAEAPLLMRLKEREGVAIVGIAWKNKPDEARAWLARLGDPFKAVGYDLDGKFALDWGLSGVPETFLVDATGKVTAKYGSVLADADAADLERKWRALNAR